MLTFSNKLSEHLNNYEIYDYFAFKHFINNWVTPEKYAKCSTWLLPIIIFRCSCYLCSDCCLNNKKFVYLRKNSRN